MTELNSYQKTMQEIPEVWYENELKIFAVGVTAMLGSIEVANGLLDTSIRNPNYFWAAGAIFLVGRVLDNLSTLHVLNLSETVSDNGVDVQIEETSVLLPKRLDKRNLFIRSPLNEGLMSTIVAVFPPLGVMLGITSTLASFNNTRLAKRINLIKNDTKL